MNVIWPAGPKSALTALGVIVAFVGLVLGGEIATPASANVAAAVTTGDPSVLNGVYRITWSEKELLAAGAPRRFVIRDFSYLHGKKVVITMTLRDGKLRLKGQPPTAWSPCNGTYAVSGKSVLIKQGPPYNCTGRIEARWSLTNDQLRLRTSAAVASGDDIVFTAKPWKKIA